jgi:hypothetical protein
MNTHTINLSRLVALLVALFLTSVEIVAMDYDAQQHFARYVAAAAAEVAVRS